MHKRNQIINFHKRKGKKMNTCIVDAIVSCKRDSFRHRNKMMFRTDVYCNGESIAHEVTHIPVILGNLDENENRSLSLNLHYVVTRRVKSLCRNKNINPDAMNLIWVYNYSCLRYDNVDFPHDSLIHNYISSVTDNYDIRPMDSDGCVLAIEFGFRYLHELIGTALRFSA